MTDRAAAPHRAAEIRARMAAAHAALAAQDPVGAAWRARAAAEALLIALAETHGVDVGTGSSTPATLESLRKALRHAKVLERRVEDHVDYVQRVGNRAAHAQARPDDQVDMAEARAVLAALDNLHRALDLLPAAEPPAKAPTAQGPTASPRTARVLWGMALVTLALVAPFAAFVATTSVLAASSPPPDPHQVAAPAAPLVDANHLEALLAEGEPDEGPSDEALATLPCAALVSGHDALWAAPMGLQDRVLAARYRALIEARSCDCRRDEGPCGP